jgi:cellulose synthase/poly-beta-1,6-N-acetylglucosamine synthase-like glycosyltransferase
MNELLDALGWFFVVGLGWAMIAYFLLINTSFLILTFLAGAEFVSHIRRSAFRGYDELFSSALTPPVSILMPANNESAGIVEAVRAMTALRYPEYEVIVIDDGSTDDTLAVLTAAFDLVAVPKVVPADVPTRGAVESVHLSTQGARNVVVVRKENGGKSDALNTGINIARYPLLCMVDADSVLDPDALLHVTKPFADDPDRVVATGGVIRAANGCRVRAGRVVDVRMPRSWLARIQVVEYLRAFLIGRTGWSRMGALLIISGAFGLFRRDLVVDAGGLAHDCIGEDAELVVRMHRRLAEQKRDYRIVFVAEPVAWTEVPETRAVLGKQRRRWQRGITEILQRHRRMVGNPRYGLVGGLAMPWFVLFEVLAPFIELAGVVYLAVIFGIHWLHGAGLIAADVDTTLAVLLIAVAWGSAVLLTVAALALEEFSFRRYRRRRDLWVAVLAAVLENIGYRQLTAWWRVRGTLQALRSTPPEWGEMTRTGFSGADDESPVGAASGAAPGRRRAS